MTKTLFGLVLLSCVVALTNSLYIQQSELNTLKNIVEQQEKQLEEYHSYEKKP